MDKNKNVIDIDITKFHNNSDLNYASIAASMTENIKTDTKESFKDIELPELNSPEDLKNLDIKYSDCHDQIRSELDDIKNAMELALGKKFAVKPELRELNHKALEMGMGLVCESAV